MTSSFLGACPRPHGRFSARVGAVALALIFVLGAAPAAASAATRYVATDGTDAANDCLEAANPCATPQHAVSVAVAGDVVQLAAGEYTLDTTINLNKRIALRGPNHGNDPTGGGAREPEAVLTVDADVAFRRAVTVAARGIEVSGLTFADNAAGVWHANNTDVGDETIANNIFRNNTDDVHVGGIGSGSPELPNLTVRSNRFEGTQTRSISMYQTIEETGLTITGNEFVDAVAPIHLGFVDGVTVSDNTFEMTDATFDYAIMLADDAANVEISGNRFEGAGAAGRAIRTWPRTNLNGPVEITGNTIRGFTEYAVDIQQDPGEATDATQVSAHGNAIVGNGSGVRNGGTGTLVATDNWWGCNGGPGAAGCDGTEGDVDADPWLVLDVTASPQAIPVDGAASQITASINSNSDGAAAGPIPDGAIVEFATSLGTLDRGQAPLSGGEATATLTSGSEPGTARVTARADAAEVATDVQFTQVGGELEPCADDPQALCVPPGDAVVEVSNETIRVEAGDGEVVIRGDGNVIIVSPGFTGTLTVDGDGNTVRAGAGDDEVVVEGCGNTVDAGPGDDSAFVRCEAPSARGGGGAARNVVRGGPGDDKLRGSGAPVTLRGADGADRLQGSEHADRLVAGRGDDRVSARGGADKVNGSKGKDRLTGGGGADFLHGGRHADLLRGGAGSDRLHGGRGRDRLKGHAGNDRLRGGPGRDNCRPGSGRDSLRGC